MYDPMLKAEPNIGPVENELPLIDEITEEACPDMYHHLMNSGGE